MAHIIRTVFNPPSFDDAEKTRIATLLFRFLQFFAAVDLIFIASLPFIHDNQSPVWIPALIIALVWIVGFILLHRGRVRFVEFYVTIAYFILVSTITYLTGDVTSPSMVNYFGVIALVGVTLGTPYALGTAFLAAANLFIIWRMAQSGLLPPPSLISTDASRWVVYSMNFLLVASLISLATWSTRKQRYRLAKGEGAIEERERYLEGVLASAPDAVVSTDAKGLVVEWNVGAANMFGYTKKEAIGRVIDELVTDDTNRYEASNLTERVLHGETIQPFETLRFSADGSAVEVIASGSAVIIDNQVIGTVAVYTDVTKARRSQRLLQAFNRTALTLAPQTDEQEILTNLVQVMHDNNYACTILIVEDGQTAKPLFIGHGESTTALLKGLTGKSREEISFNIEGIDELERIVRKRETVALSDSSDFAARLLPNTPKEITKRIFSILELQGFIAAPIPVDDEVVGIFAIQYQNASDSDLAAVSSFALQIAGAILKARLLERLEENVSELTRTQTRLIQAQKMEAMGRLAGGIAHDFNNLLTAISGYADLLSEQLSENKDAKQDLGEIVKAANRASSLTAQLLAFSRKQVLKPQILNINSEISDIEGMLRRLIGEDVNIKIQTHAHDGLVQADPTQLQQVVMNLALNARDAMPNGGVMTISTGIDRVSEKESVILSVSDTGIGMDEETQERIFEPFFTTKNLSGGTGLGMATVHGIVAQSGGHILVDSILGLGTSISVFLPIASAQPSDQTIGKAEAGIQRGIGTVLLVEDETSVRELGRRVLEDVGYTVITAANARVAMRKAERSRSAIDIVVTDIVMPGDMDGVELVECLTREKPELKALLVSGYPKKEVDAEKSGTFLKKPFTPDELKSAVSSALNRK